MKKILTSGLTFVILIFLTLSFLDAKDICKLGYEVSSNKKEMNLTIMLPDKSLDYKIDSTSGSVSIRFSNFDGIIVSEKDAVEGFIEKVSLSDTNSPGQREILLKLSSAFLSGIEKDGVSLKLRFAKFSAYGDTKLSSVEQNYIIGIDDKLLIFVYNNPDLSKTIQVAKDGKANFSLLGDIEVTGLTVSQLTEKITHLYGKDFIVDPQVTIEVVEYNSQWAYVTGEVSSKKKVALKGTTTIKDAIAEAGGLTAFAGTEILISRKTGSGDESEQIKVDRTAFEEGIANITLVNGDVITVPKIKYAYIQGEVRRNCDIMLEKGMTLLKAISIAQGLTDWADDRVEILRESPSGQIKESYNLKKILDGKNPDVLLKPGDIIIVKKRFL